VFAALLCTLLFSISITCGHRSAKLIGGTEANFWRLTLAALLLGVWAYTFGIGLGGAAFPLFFVGFLFGQGSMAWLMDLGIILFGAAYLAETVRGGLQAIPKGQVEAAQTIGLTYWQTQRKIVLPQALTMVVPGIMNSFIATFKDTSLVTIVSLYELTGAMSLALNSDVEWRPFKIEGYLFITAIYFVFCFAMSRYSLWVEKQLNRSKNR
jgi:ABC-type amino acid transport system permease subunit